MEEQRTRSRQRTLKAGTISFSHFSGIDCVVRNISKTGACLEIDGALGIPNHFTLIIKSDHLMRLCHVAWRAGRKIGVKFEPTH